MEGRPVNATFHSCVPFFWSAFSLPFYFWFPSPSTSLLLSLSIYTYLSVLCFFFFVFCPLSLVLPHSRCRPLSFVILCSAASGSGGWLLKTVKTMVNAGSRLCAFVRWFELASPMLLVFIFYHLQFWDEGTKTMVGLGMFVQLRWQAKAGVVAVLVSSQRGKEKPRRACSGCFWWLGEEEE